jgi:putative tricarboxylic transport membrane protein
MTDALLAAAAGILLDPQLLLVGVIAAGLGIVLGALPGISSTMSLAVLLPFSFVMGLAEAMVFLMGIFYGSVYGGSLSAILLNIPGTPGSMVTQLDGYPMARQGRAGDALAHALFASTLGGVFGLVGLIVLAPLLARVALLFQSPEFAALMLFGLTMLAYAAPGSTYLGILAGVVGLILGAVGLDTVTNFSRLDFGLHNLQAGINLIPVVIGIFGLAEVMRNLDSSQPLAGAVVTIGRLMPDWRKMLGKTVTALRSSVFGLVVGAVPAAGSAVAVSMAYAQEKRLYDGKETFGDGNPRGVVAAEAANNACVGGALIPMMTVGIPGDTMTAVLIGALLIHGLRPGPGLFTRNPEFVATVYTALGLAIVLTLLWALLAIRLVARLLGAPARILNVTIALLCVVGAYSVQNSAFDVHVMIASGAVGYLMAKVGMPTAPVVFGLVLGPLLEENLRRSLIVYGSWTVFFQRPITLALIVISLFTLLWPLVSAMRRRRAG